MNGKRIDEQISTIKYIGDMLGQLRFMAASQKLDLLAYLIDMAHIEATDVARKQHQSIEADKGDSAA